MPEPDVIPTNSTEAVGDQSGRKARQAESRPAPDPFLAYRIYEEPSSLFSSHPPIEDIKDECHIVLDTNALLLPYNTGKESLASISQTFERFVTGDMLTVPGHVAREFVKNRTRKIKDLFNALVERRGRLQGFDDAKLRYPLLESLSEYQSLVQVESEVNQQIAELSKRYKQAVEKLLEKVEAWNWNDPVSREYARLFTGKVVRDVKMPHDEIKKDYEWRKAYRIPPGYQDQNKESQIPDDGEPWITNEMGDLIVWHTILEIGKEKQTPLIFVSSDRKNDWRIKSGGKHLYPRYELIYEYAEKSGGKGFYMVTLSEFLDLYGEPQAVVQEVQAEETMPATQLRFDPFRDLVLSDSVEQFLLGLFADMRVGVATSELDLSLIMTMPDGKQIGIEVINAYPHPTPNLDKIAHARNWYLSNKVAYQLNDFWIFIVGNSVFQINDLLNRAHKIIDNVLLVGGLLSERDEFLIVGANGINTPEREIVLRATSPLREF